MEFETLEYYLIAMSIMTFAAFGVDKLHAIKGKARIRNATLLGLSLVGGAVGGFLAMHLFHHKTCQKPYTIGIPLMILLQAVVWAFVRLGLG